MLVVPAVTNFRKQVRGKVVLQNIVVHRRFHARKGRVVLHYTCIRLRTTATVRSLTAATAPRPSISYSSPAAL